MPSSSPLIPTASSPCRRSSLVRLALRMLAAVGVLVVACWLAFQLSPWPGAWLICRAFSAEGGRIAEALGKHVPVGVNVIGNDGVPADSLFFPDNYTPALPHEYQFNLDTDARRLALERSLAFLGTK